MRSLQITYGTYPFHEEGVVHYGTSMQPEDTNSPSVLTETFKLKFRFFESSFADNEARWSKLKTALRNTPRGTLTIVDENGQTIEARTVKFTGMDGDPEWGQFRRELSLSFEASAGTGTVTGLSASYTPRGGIAIELPNVNQWAGQVKTDRYSTHAAIRREGVESISASGRWAPDSSLSDTARRDALLARKAMIEAAANCKDGTLIYGPFSRTMQIETLGADIGDGLGALTWSLSAFRRTFPDGEYAEADYTFEASEELEEGRKTSSLSGKIVADTEANARAEAERIRQMYSTGRIYLNGQTTKRVVDGEDGEDPCVELSFAYRFRETMDVVSYTLKVTTAADIRSGDETISYSGKVVAKTAAAALSKAREIGDQRQTVALLLMSKTEDVNSAKVEGSAEEFLSVDFSYTYLGKLTVKFAEVQVDEAYDFYGQRTVNVSGYATAVDRDTALTFARTFKILGLLQLGLRESEGKMVKETLGHFVRVDFGYNYGKAFDRVTIGYAHEVSHDYQERETSITFQGQAFGPDPAQCDALINSVVGINLGSAARKMMDSRTNDWRRDLTASNATLFLHRAFQVRFVTPLSAADASDIDIIDATYSIQVRWGVWKSVIDEIPFGVPFVQKGVARTCGSIQVTGNVTAVTESSARQWGRNKRALATGEFGEPEETTTFVYLPRNGTQVKHHVFSFSYSSMDPNKVWTFG